MLHTRIKESQESYVLKKMNNNYEKIPTRTTYNETPRRQRARQPMNFMHDDQLPTDCHERDGVYKFLCTTASFRARELELQLAVLGLVFVLSAASPCCAYSFFFRIGPPSIIASSMSMASTLALMLAASPVGTRIVTSFALQRAHPTRLMLTWGRGSSNRNDA